MKMKSKRSLAHIEDLDLTLQYLKSEDDKVWKDFMLLRDTFSREIELKEKKRSGLITNIQQLELREIEDSNKKDIIDNNLEIYKNNLKEIKKRLNNLNEREKWIKKNYTNLVRGAIKNPKQLLDKEKSNSISEIFYDLFKDNMKNQGHLVKTELEELQYQKENFLENLKKLFENYDNELISIHEEKIKLNRLDKEIEVKQKNGRKMKKDMETHFNNISEQILKSDQELVATSNEEKALIAEFQKILQNIKTDLNISDAALDILSAIGNSTKKQKA